MTDSPLPFVPALHAGARALTMQAVASLPAADSTRLVDSAFRLEVDTSQTPPEAALTIEGDAEPIFRVPASAWPAGFGEAVAAFIDATLSRLSSHERRLAAGLIPRAHVVAVLEPVDLGEDRVELRIGDAVAVLGRIGADDGGVTH
jgi:hypothetical protein